MKMPTDADLGGEWTNVAMPPAPVAMALIEATAVIAVIARRGLIDLPAMAPH
jgi:hypothetical protein